MRRNGVGWFSDNVQTDPGHPHVLRDHPVISIANIRGMRTESECRGAARLREAFVRNITYVCTKLCAICL